MCNSWNVVDLNGMSEEELKQFKEDYEWDKKKKVWRLKNYHENRNERSSWIRRILGKF